MSSTLMSPTSSFNWANVPTTPLSCILPARPFAECQVLNNTPDIGIGRMKKMLKDFIECPYHLAQTTASFADIHANRAYSGQPGVLLIKPDTIKCVTTSKRDLVPPDQLKERVERARGKAQFVLDSCPE